MARTEIPIVVLDPATGNALSGANVAVALRSTSAAATIYAAETGGTTVANPRTTDTYGRLTGWVERGAYTLTISGSTLTTYVKNWDSAPAADSSIDALWIGSALPIGLVNPFAGSTAPTGWLLCNGASVSTTTYAALFSVVAYTYGGSGSSFTLPDLRGRVPMGAGTGAGLTARAVAATPGAETAALAATDIPAHSHGAGSLIIPPHSHTVDAAAAGSPFTVRPQLAGTAGSTPVTSSTAISANAVTGSTANSTAASTAPANVQPSLVLNYIIRAL